MYKIYDDARCLSKFINYIKKSETHKFEFIKFNLNYTYRFIMREKKICQRRLLKCDLLFGKKARKL